MRAAMAARPDRACPVAEPGSTEGRSKRLTIAIKKALGDLIRRRWAGAARGHDRDLRAEPPLRSELLSADQLTQHARTLAGSDEIDRRRGPDRLLPRLAENEVALLHAYELVTNAAEQGRHTPA